MCGCVSARSVTNMETGNNNNSNNYLHNVFVEKVETLRNTCKPDSHITVGIFMCVGLRWCLHCLLLLFL